MSLRQQLKTATQPYHDQTEQLSSPSAEFSLDDYRTFLRTGWLFHSSLESSLTDFLPDWLKADLRWSHRLKAPRLAQDLRELAVDLAALPPLPFPVRTVPEALGALYVAEGSTLGGIMMKKMWQDHPVIGQRSSFRFLGCYDPETGTYWKSFIAVLEANVSGSADEATTVAAAQTTFTFYQACHQQVRALGQSAPMF